MINTTLCYIEHGGQYLMLHRTKKKGDLNAGKWIGVGGKFEPGETADECVVREVYEETGLTLTEYERVGLVKFVSDVYEDEDMYLYRGIAYTGSLREDCPEGELKWIPVEEVPKLPTWEGDTFFLQALLEHRKNINMTVRYEGAALAEFRDDSADVEIERSLLLKASHGFSTRIGGVSEGIFSSLNLGRNRGDIPERVNENWRLFLEKCGISVREVVWGKQVHGNYVHVVKPEDLCKPSEASAPMEADGFVTDQKGIPLAVFTADCVPVLLEDAKHGVIGAVHSGWRSTIADIEGQAIEKMISLGANVNDICVAIGPAIDECCFEVGPEVILAVDNLLGEDSVDYYHKKGEKYMLDLRGVVMKRFLQLGVLPQNIERVGGCTMCNPQRFWSHRHTGGERGSQAAVIMRSMSPYIPRKIQELLGKQEYIKNEVGMSASDVLIFPNHVLKIQEHTPETDNENEMIAWLKGRIPVPEVPAYVVENERAYMLMSRIQGKMLCDEEYMNDPKRLIKLAAKGLKLLWSVDIGDCPCTFSRLDERLKTAGYYIEHGLVDVDNVEPDTFGPGGFQNPGELLKWLENNRPKEDLVLTHGDYCLPNILVRDNEISGFIDLGKMGPADRWQDVAICYRSLKHNFSGKYNGGKAYPEFEPQMLFDELGIEMDEEKLKYYILLDELF